MMNEHFIPSLHFYCDRWCERCILTQNCEIFFEQSRLNFESDDSDIKNKLFWDKFRQKYSEAMIPLRAKGIETVFEQAPLNEHHEPDHTLTDEELGTKMTDYGRNANVWFELNYEMITESVATTSEVMNMDTEFIQETIEVINWYQHFIGIKFKISLKNDDHEDVVEKEYLNGTRKITLIGLERSISAWSILLNELPEFGDDIIHFISTLTFLRKEFLLRYPGMVNFKRPGFDV